MQNVTNLMYIAIEWTESKRERKKGGGVQSAAKVCATVQRTLQLILRRVRYVANVQRACMPTTERRESE